MTISQHTVKNNAKKRRPYTEERLKHKQTN